MLRLQKNQIKKNQSLSFSPKNSFSLLLIVLLFCILSPLQLKADKWRFLSEEQEALQCRFDLIQQAEYEILLSYFIFKDDQVGKAILHLLVEAAQERGVKIKVMVDGHNHKISKKIRAYLATQGVELRKFSVKRLGKFGLFRGLHEKMLIVDSKWLITGGRNIEDKYFGLNDNFNFKDLDVLVEGVNVGKDARFHFFESWHNPKVAYPLKFCKRHIKKQSSVQKTLEAAFRQISLNFQKGYNPKFHWLENAFETEHPISFIHDDLFELKDSIYIKSDLKDNKCTQELIDLMSTAQSHIIIENPYFIPTPTWEKFFAKAQKKGIKVTVLVNSIQSNDMIVYQAAYLNRRKTLLQLGIDIWEYHGSKKLHLKTMIIDDEISIVGSYNVHYPSEILNTEVVVVVRDKAVAEYHLQLIKQNLKNAVHINKDNKAEFPPDHQFPKPSCKRKVSVFFARITIALWLNRYL